MANWSVALCTIMGASLYLRAATELPRLLVGDAVGPRLFPELVGAGLLIGGLLLAWETWRKRAQAMAGPVAAAPAGSERPPALILAALVAWTTLYYVAFEPVGYIVATFVYAGSLLCFFHRTAWWKNLLIAAAFTGVAYLLFGVALKVVLPSGVLGFLDSTS